jgi:hypothetical protein
VRVGREPARTVADLFACAALVRRRSQDAPQAQPRRVELHRLCSAEIIALRRVADLSPVPPRHDHPTVPTRLCARHRAHRGAPPGCGRQRRRPQSARAINRVMLVRACSTAATLDLSARRALGSPARAGRTGIVSGKTARGAGAGQTRGALARWWSTAWQAVASRLSHSTPAVCRQQDTARMRSVKSAVNSDGTVCALVRFGREPDCGVWPVRPRTFLGELHGCPDRSRLIGDSMCIGVADRACFWPFDFFRRARSCS